MKSTFCANETIPSNWPKGIVPPPTTDWQKKSKPAPSPIPSLAIDRSVFALAPGHEGTARGPSCRTLCCCLVGKEKGPSGIAAAARRLGRRLLACYMSRVRLLAGGV